MPKETRRESRTRRHERVREHIRGSAARPRLAGFRSLSHIYAQLIDDEAGKTLVAASSGDVKDAEGSKTERGKAGGGTVGERGNAKGNAAAGIHRRGHRGD